MAEDGLSVFGTERGRGVVSGGGEGRRVAEIILGRLAEKGSQHGVVAAANYYVFAHGRGSSR